MQGSNPKHSMYPMGTGVMYHVSPRKNREDILSGGLQGHERDNLETPWKYHWDQPEGNYLFKHPEDARQYAYTLRSQQTGTALDEEPEWDDMYTHDYPEGFEGWDDDQRDNWYEENDPVERTDDLHGYDIYAVNTHGLPIAPDPETRVVDGPWDLGRTHDLYEEQASGYQGTPSLSQLHNDVGGYHGDEPVRQYVPQAIHPNRIQLHEHMPTWGMSSEGWEDTLSDTPGNVPSVWMQTPMTEWPQPGHDPRLSSWTAGITHEPGQWGRGVITPQGQVHTWPEELASHYQYIYNMLGDWDMAPYDKFMVQPDGTPIQVSDPSHKPLVEEALHMTSAMSPSPSPWNFSPLSYTGEENSTELDIKLAAMTRAQRQQLAQEIEGYTGPDASWPIHQFPDGWSIRQLRRWGDMEREGQLMRNCLRLEDPNNEWMANEANLGSLDQDYDKEFPNSVIYSLRDPHNLPHATFYQHGLDKPRMGEVLGQHNSYLKPEYVAYLDAYAKEHDVDVPNYVYRRKPDQWEMDRLDGQDIATQNPGQQSFAKTAAAFHPKHHTTAEDHERGKARYGLPKPHKTRKLVLFPKRRRKGAVDPQWLQQWIEANGPWLYHSCSPDVRDKILKEGLIPHDRGPGTKYDGTLVPRDNAVYVRAIPRPSENHTTWGEGGFNQIHLGRVGIDLRKLDPSRLQADEDAWGNGESIYQSIGIPRTRDNYVNNVQTLQDTEGNRFPNWGAWADHWQLNQPGHTAHSLNSLYTASVFGGISPDALMASEDIPEHERPVERIQKVLPAPEPEQVHAAPAYPKRRVPCSYCKGEGQVLQDDWGDQWMRPCPECRGDGYLVNALTAGWGGFAHEWNFEPHPARQGSKTAGMDYDPERPLHKGTVDGAGRVHVWPVTRSGVPHHDQAIEAMDDWQPGPYLDMENDEGHMHDFVIENGTVWPTLPEEMPQSIKPLIIQQVPGVRFPSRRQLQGAKTSAWHFADKLHDFLMNPKSRPDLQTPEGQAFLKTLEGRYWNEKTDALMPWLAKEWKKGRIHHRPETRAIGYDDDTDFRRVITPERLNHWGDFLQSDHPMRRDFGDLMKSQVSFTPTWKHHHTGEIYTGPRDHPNDERLPDPDVPHFPSVVNQWDEAMAQQSHQEALDSGDIVHRYPDGWSLQHLKTPEALKAEGDAMGHCVGGYGDAVAKGRSMIYSLRDPNGSPHVTTEIQPTQSDPPDPKWIEEAMRWDPVARHLPDEHKGYLREYHQRKLTNPNGDLSPYPLSEGLTGVQGLYNELAKQYANPRPIPHQGQVVQVQGRGNETPKDEYKARLRDWFRTFPPEDRPKGNSEDWESLYDEQGYVHTDLDDPALIPHYEDEYGRLHKTNDGTEDEYGLLAHAQPMEADYDGLLKNIGINDHGYHATHNGQHVDDIYRLALARGEIPQLSQAAQSYQEHANEMFDEWEHQNYDYFPRYPDASEPDGYHDEEGQEAEQGHAYWKVMPSSYQSDDVYYDPIQAEQAYNAEMAELYQQHPQTQASSQLYGLLNQHVTTPDGYGNELAKTAGWGDHDEISPTEVTDIYRPYRDDPEDGYARDPDPREPIPATMYHKAPGWHRSLIEQHGLLPDPSSVGGERIHHWAEPGVYMTTSPTKAWGSGGTNYWQVDTTKLDRQHFKQDRNISNAWYYTQPIPPEAITYNPHPPTMVEDYKQRNPHHNLRPVVGGMTLPQEQRHWEQLNSALSQAHQPQREVVHVFPNGYTIQENTNANDINRVGQFMQNCWQSTKQENLDQQQTGGWKYLSMHDEHDLPRVAFFTQRYPTSTVIKSPLGMRNQEIGDQHMDMLAEWADQAGVNRDSVLKYDFYPQPHQIGNRAITSHQRHTSVLCLACLGGLCSRHKDQGPWIPSEEKTAGQSPSVMYHVAPSHLHGQIMAQGLKPSLGMDEGYQAPSVYLFDHPEDARYWQGLPTPGIGQEPKNIYQVDVSGLPLAEDEYLATDDNLQGQSWRVEQPIGPERIQGTTASSLRSTANSRGTAYQPPSSHTRETHSQAMLSPHPVDYLLGPDRYSAWHDVDNVTSLLDHFSEVLQSPQSQNPCKTNTQPQGQVEASVTKSLTKSLSDGDRQDTDSQMSSWPLSLPDTEGSTLRMVQALHPSPCVDGEQGKYARDRSPHSHSTSAHSLAKDTHSAQLEPSSSASAAAEGLMSEGLKGIPFDDITDRGTLNRGEGIFDGTHNRAQGISERVPFSGSHLGGSLSDGTEGGEFLAAPYWEIAEFLDERQSGHR